MQLKEPRQKKILELVSRQGIETQQALAAALQAAGFGVTQATVSRDIRELNLVKELGVDGRYRYAAPVREGVRNYSERLKKIFQESVTSVACAQNLVVLKTLPGLASAACSAIDDMGASDLAGTLAGDDTAFLAMLDKAAAERLCREIEGMMRH